jgi:general secretion pathway protein L
LATILKQRVLGLDIGAHSVKAAEIVHTPFRGLEIGQLRTLPLEPGADLAAELREFLRVYELPTDAVVCALPGDRVSSRRLSFPFSDVKRIAQAVPFEVEGQVPFDLDEFLLDWEPVRRHRGATDVMATLARRSEVGTLLEALREAGIEPRVVEAEGRKGSCSPTSGSSSSWPARVCSWTWGTARRPSACSARADPLPRARFPWPARP